MDDRLRIAQQVDEMSMACRRLHIVTWQMVNRKELVPLSPVPGYLDSVSLLLDMARASLKNAADDETLKQVQGRA